MSHSHFKGGFRVIGFDSQGLGERCREIEKKQPWTAGLPQAIPSTINPVSSAVLQNEGTTIDVLQTWKGEGKNAPCTSTVYDFQQSVLSS